jgi:hypothetical protein
VYIYNCEHIPSPPGFAKQAIKDIRMVATAKHLIKALKARKYSIQQVLMCGGDSIGQMLCERKCCEFLMNDVISYLEKKEKKETITKDTISSFCSQLEWESLYFS